MTISHKLFLGFIAVALVVVVVGSVAVKISRDTHDNFEQITRETIPLVDALDDVRVAGVRIVASTSEYGFIRAEYETAEKNSTGEPLYLESAVAEEEELIQEGIKLYDSALERCEHLISSYYPEYTEQLTTIAHSGRELQRVSKEIIALKAANVSGLAVLEKKVYFENVEKSFLSAVDIARKYVDRDFNKREEQGIHLVHAAISRIAWMSILTIVIALAVWLFLARTIATPIGKLKILVEEFGRCNFDARAEITSNDETAILAKTFNQMATHLQKTTVSRDLLLKEIEERTQAEEALRESEERHRVLFDSSRDAIMLLAPPSWNFTSGNPTSVRMFGARDEQDFCSRSPWKYSPDFQPDGSPSDDKAREMIQTAMREGSNFFEWRHRRTDGEEFPATVLLSRIEISGQALPQATVRDISKRKKSEEQLLNKSRELETLTEDLRKLSSMISKEDELSRRKLAGILHEQIGQNLAVFSMNFDDIAAGVITGETDIKDAISNLTTLLEDTIKSTRELTADLYPTILDDLGFLPAVTWYKELVLDPLKIEVLMEIDNSVEGLSSDYKLSLFRILQEAIQNIAKHARATEVEVKYTTQNNTRKLYIKDNGIGFDTCLIKKKKEKGIGLLLLKERSLSLGGNLNIESALGKGTELTVELPISNL